MWFIDIVVVMWNNCTRTDVLVNSSCDTNKWLFVDFLSLVAWQFFSSKCNNKPLAAGHRLEPLGELTALDIGGGEGGKGCWRGWGGWSYDGKGQLGVVQFLKFFFKKALIEIYNNRTWQNGALTDNNCPQLKIATNIQLQKLVTKLH